MTDGLTILVIGATGQQGGAVTRVLLSKGHRVRAFTRNADSPAAQELARLGADLAVGHAEDRESVVRACRGMDSVYAMSTFFESGTEGEVEQGKNIAEAVSAAGTAHLVFSSVASANLSTRVPHFESKYEIERHIESLSIPSTIVAPVYFCENLLSPWTLPGLAEGSLSMSMPPDRPLQQIPVGDIASFVLMALEDPSRFTGKRFDIASDELTGKRAGEVLSGVIGHPIDFVQTPIAGARAMSEDVALMYEWFDEVGYSADIPSLRREYPEVGWRTFEQWAEEQDWGKLDAQG